MTGQADLNDQADIGSPSEASLLGRSVSGAAWLMVEMCGLQGLSLLIFGYLAHLLSPTDFGLASIGFVATQALRSTVQDRIPEAAAMRPAASAEEWTAAFWLSAVAGGLLMLTLLAAAAPLERLLSMPGLAHVLRGMALVVLTCGFGRTHEQWLTRRMMFRTLALRGIAGALVGGVAGILAAYSGWGVDAIVVQQVVGTLVALALLWMTCPWRPTLRFHWRVVPGILAHLRDTAPGGLVYIASQTCDTLLVGVWFGAGVAGLYGLAKRLRLALQHTAVVPVTGVMLPLFAEAAAHPARFNRLVGRMLNIVTIVGAPVFVGTSFVSADLINVIFGSQWAAAAPIFAGFVLGGLGFGPQSCFNVIMLTHHRRRWPTYLSLLEIALSLGMFALIARKFGPSATGLALAAPLAVSVPLAGILAMFATARNSWAWVRSIVPSSICVFAMVITLLVVSPALVNLRPIVRLGANVGIGGVMYIFVLAITFDDALTQLSDATKFICKPFKRIRGA